MGDDLRLRVFHKLVDIAIHNGDKVNQQLACDFILAIAKGEIVEMECQDEHGNDKKVILTSNMGVCMLQCVLDLAILKKDSPENC